MDQKELNEIMPSMSVSRYLEISTPAKTSRKRECRSVYVLLIHTLPQFSYADDSDCVPYFAIVNSALPYVIPLLFLWYLN